MSEEQTENREAEEDIGFVRVSAQRRVCSDSRRQVLGLRHRGAGVTANGPTTVQCAWASILGSQVQVVASTGHRVALHLPSRVCSRWIPDALAYLFSPLRVCRLTRRERVSTSLLDALGKRSFRACKRDPCCQPGPLTEPNPPATCGQRCLPTRTRPPNPPWVPGLNYGGQRSGANPRGLCTAHQVLVPPSCFSEKSSQEEGLF